MVASSVYHNYERVRGGRHSSHLPNLLTSQAPTATSTFTKSKLRALKLPLWVLGKGAVEDRSVPDLFENWAFATTTGARVAVHAISDALCSWVRLLGYNTTTTQRRYVAVTCKFGEDYQSE
jgi:hypothetical protein